MTTLTWIAGNPGNWFTAANWSTNSTPQIGDTMIVASGTAIISADPHPTIGGESIVLGGANAGATVTLQAIDTTFTASPSDIATTITVSGGDGPSALHATLLVEGASFLQDQIFVQAAGGKLTIDSESDGSTPGNFTITNATDESLILVSHESFLDLTGQTITNRGTIEIDGAARVDAGATLAGDGFVVLQGGGHLAVAGTVGTDQTVDFEDATGLLTITSGSQFDGWIELTVAGARIDLTGVAAQSRGYDTQTDTLTLYAGPNQSGAVLAQLHVTGETDLATHDFTLSGDGTGGTLVTYAPGGATTLAQANPVPVVAAAGTMVSLASILAQSFGTANPGFYGLTLREAPGAAKSGKDVGYWVEGAGAVTPVWYVNGQPMAGKEYKVQPGDDVQLLAGNAIKPIEIKAQVTPAATGDTAEFVTYDIYTVDPAVAAKLAGPPTSAGEVASAETYAAAFGHVPNTNFCYVIAENVAAGNGAAMSSHWDWSLVPTLNTTGGFWRIVYNGSQAQTPVANWSTLVQPGDIVGMDWLGDDSSGPVELQGGHVTSVLAGGGPGNTAPIKVFDNVFGDGAEIGIHNVTYWTETDPSTIIIWRLDPHQQYLIQGSGLGEFIQGSVHNNLIQPGGGADSITAGLGNNEIQDTLAHLNGIALTDFHLGDTFDFTDLAPLNTTVSYAGGAMHVFKNNRPVADVAMPGLGAGQTFAVASDGGGGSRIGITLATSLMQAQFSAKSLVPTSIPPPRPGSCPSCMPRASTSMPAARRRCSRVWRPMWIRSPTSPVLGDEFCPGHDRHQPERRDRDRAQCQRATAGQRERAAGGGQRQ